MFPQGPKPKCIWRLFGAAKAVPFQNSSTLPVFGAAKAAPFQNDASRHNGGFNFAAAVHQLFEDTVQLVEMRMAGDERAGLEAATGD